MSLQGKTFLSVLAGGLAGLLIWVLTDLGSWFESIFEHHRQGSIRLILDPRFLLYGALFGLLLGLLLAIIDSLALESSVQVRRRLLAGCSVGFLGGWICLVFGQVIFASLQRVFHVDPESLNPSALQYIILMIGRALSYALLGGLVGAAQGISIRSAVIARQGAAGGLLGGSLGGTTFELLSGTDSDTAVSRLLPMIVTGALIGFFVSAAQDFLKQAWIRIVTGKNEGQEYLISKRVTTIGRSELSDIRLKGDPSIAHDHVTIEALSAQNRHRLRFVGATGLRGAIYAPPLINGHPVTNEQWLADGDTVQVGRRTLQFHEKATRNNGFPLLDAGKASGENPSSTRYVGDELFDKAEFSPLVSRTVTESASSSPEASPGVGIDGMKIGLGTRLTCISGPYTGQSFLLSHEPVTIGRGSDRDISLTADTSVSRTHVRLVYRNGKHVAADDSSSNGTLVNEMPITDAYPLNVGDILQIGETALRYD